MSQKRITTGGQNVTKAPAEQIIMYHQKSLRGPNVTHRKITKRGQFVKMSLIGKFKGII